MEEPLRGRVAIVTGAGRGIGRAIALGYAGAGAAVCCTARTAGEIEETAALILAQGGQAMAVQADVSQFDQVEAMMAHTVERFGGFDILVINAGVDLDKRSVEASVPADWEATLAINLTGAYYCARAAIPHLKARGGGKIITVGSGLGHKGRVERSAYACSKAGLWMLTRVLAQELWPYQISVNELIPGPVDTAMTFTGSARDTVIRDESEWWKQPEEVVPLALFLATQPEKGPTAQSFSLMRRDN
jgi:3-oxoacyl-[acyl-carrier protein] reductase